MKEIEERLTAKEIMKINIPHGIVNIKAIGKGNGKPQYRAECAVIIKCMEIYAEQEANQSHQKLKEEFEEAVKELAKYKLNPTVTINDTVNYWHTKAGLTSEG